MARHCAKRKQVRRPGLVEAAKALGCTLSHLRRCVIGERESRSLMKRYREFKRQEREQLKRHVAQLPAIAAENHSAPLDLPNTA